MRACFSFDGNVPDINEELTILVITGRVSLKEDLNRVVGSGSSAHDVILEDFIAFRTSSSETLANSLKVESHVSGRISEEGAVLASCCRLDCSFLILLSKNTVKKTTCYLVDRALMTISR